MRNGYAKGIIELSDDAYIEVRIGGLDDLHYRFVRNNIAGDWWKVPILFAKTYNDGSKIRKDDSGAFFHAVDRHGNPCDWKYFLSDVHGSGLTDGEEELNLP